MVGPPCLVQVTLSFLRVRTPSLLSSRPVGSNMCPQESFTLRILADELACRLRGLSGALGQVSAQPSHVHPFPSCSGVNFWLILGPSRLIPDAAEKILFRFRNIEVKQQLVAGSVAAGPGVSLSGETAEGQGVLLECQIVTHRNATWEDLQQR